MEKTLSDYLHGRGTLDACRTGQDFDALCRAVRADGAGRLRWRLERALGIPPWAQPPGRDDYLYALAQLCADREEALDALCPACRARAQEELCARCGKPLPIKNPAFDEARFEELKQNGTSL